MGIPTSSLVSAGNFLSAKIVGRTLEDARASIQEELDANRAELDQVSQRLVESGLAGWSGDATTRSLIVRGQAKLLDDVTAIADLERVRRLFEVLETKETMMRLVEATNRGEGVQIYIGAANPLFGVAGCSMVVAPYLNSREQIIGAIGVIGPTRINYARIIPMVDYTAKMIGRFIG
jgi:heat-inducible transcriptional repressor